MSSRAFQRALKSKDIENTFVSEEESEHEYEKVAKRQNPFDLLSNEDPDDEDSDSSNKDELSNILEISKADLIATEEQIPMEVPKVSFEEEMPADPAPRENSLVKVSHSQSKPHQFKPVDLFRVDRKFRNSESELNRLFGTSRNTSTSTRFTRRYLIANPPQESSKYWPELPKVMDLVFDEKQDSFVFTHPEKTQRVEQIFFQLVESLNIEALKMLLQENPSHVSTLVLLSYSAVQTGDYQNSFDLLQRAFVSFEKCFYSEFKILDGEINLKYSLYPNRVFFLALFLHIFLLQRKGCWRTALEASKILYRINTLEDPMYSLLLMDFLALKAGEYQFVVDVFNSNQRFSELLNWKYNVALSTYFIENKARLLKLKKKREISVCKEDLTEDFKESRRLLIMAINSFPKTCNDLLETIGSQVRLSGYKNVSAPSVLSAFFIFRNISVWKQPEVIDWLTLVVQNSDFNFRIESKEELSIPLCRHIFLTDWTNSSTSTGSSDQFSKFIPMSIIQENLPWGLPQTYISDPFPPSEPRAIFPYSNYFKKQLMLKRPYQVLNVLLQDKDKTINGILHELDLTLDDFPVDIREVLTNLSNNTTDGVFNIFQSFMESLMPWRSLRATGEELDIKTRSFLLHK